MNVVEEFTGSNDPKQIVKGKRTKRPRASPPFGVATVTSSSSSGGNQDVCFSTSSPSNSGEIYASTEEEEDMANCLILLAQSGSPCFTQTASGKAGFYVYECKTCNRTFSSFQALGGHRASHKRPKGMLLEKKSDENKKEEGQLSKNNFITPLSLVPSDNKAKVHECLICGSEFASGQALGGHMRRHRNPNSSRMSPIEESGEGEKPRRNMLLLDLNLPAPEDDHRDSKFQFAPNQQHIVFSVPALVGCHY